MERLAIKVSNSRDLFPCERQIRIPLALVLQFLNEMKMKKPHLEIEDLQFVKKTLIRSKEDHSNRPGLDEDYYGFDDEDNNNDDEDNNNDDEQWDERYEIIEEIKWVYFKAYDTELKIHKTLKVQFLETLINTGFGSFMGELEERHQAFRDTIKNDFVLKIYDYYFFSAFSSPLYFVVEQEFVEQTLKNYKNKNKISSSPEWKNHKYNCFNYLRTTLKPFLQLSIKRYERRKRYYVVRNRDNTFTFKLDPLDEKFFPMFGDCDKSLNLGKQFNYQINLSFSEMKQSLRKEEVKNNEMKEDISNQDVKEEQSEEEQSEEEQSEDNHNLGDIILRFSSEPIKQANLIEVLKQEFALLLNYHSIQLFEIISQHPKLDNFQFISNQQSTIILSVTYLPFEKQEYYLKCQKYESMFEAETIYKTYQLLQKGKKDIFIPIVECELIPLEDCTYILYVEQNLSGLNKKIMNLKDFNSLGSSHYKRNQLNIIQSIKKDLLFWLIEQDEYFLSLNLNKPSIFQLEVSIAFDETNMTQYSFYLSNSLFHINSSCNSTNNILLIAQLTEAYIYDKKVCTVLQDRIKSFALSAFPNGSKESSKRYSLRSCFDNKFQQLHELTINNDRQFNFVFNEQFEIILYYNQQILSKISNESIKSCFAQGGFSFVCNFQIMNKIIRILRKLNAISPVSEIKFCYESTLTSEADNQHLNQFHNLFPLITSISLIICNIGESGLSKVQFEQLSKLEIVSIIFRECSLHFNGLQNRKAVKNLLAIFNNQNLKKIKFESDGLFTYINDNKEVQKQIKQEMIVARNPQKRKNRLHFVNDERSEGNKKRDEENEDNNEENEEIDEENEEIDEENEDNDEENEDNDEENEGNDEIGEGSVERDNKISLKNLKIQIKGILEKYSHLKCSVIEDKQNSNNYLVMFEHIDNSEEGDKLEINLLQNNEEALELTKFDTRYSKRLLSSCNSNSNKYLVDNLLILVQDWLVSEYQTKVYKEVFKKKISSECIHYDQNEIVKSTYKFQQNLNELTLSLSYCSHLEKMITLDNDYFCFSNLHKLHTLIFVHEAKITPKILNGLIKSIALCKSIKVVKLCFFDKFKNGKKGKDKIKLKFLKLPQLICLTEICKLQND